MAYNWIVCQFRGAWKERRDGVFEEWSDTPKHTKQREGSQATVTFQKEVSNILVILSKLQISETSNALPLSEVCKYVLLLFKLAYKWVLKQKESF